MSILRPSLLGGVDGVITSFAIVAGAHAGDVDERVVLIIGLSSLLADGLSMGVSEIISNSGTETIRRTTLMGLACFGSFVVCGVVPVVVYVFARDGLLACIMFSLVELTLLGSIRGILLKQGILGSVAQTTILGGLAGTVAYAIGRAISHY